VRARAEAVRNASSAARRRASAGVRYAVEASRGLPVRFIVQAPSCVPPQPGLELSGADLYGPEITEIR
jgi:adenine deaminase